MLSVKVLSSSKAAITYYNEPNHYGIEAKGIWYGKGAEDLNLAGEFDPKCSKEFKDALNGVTPSGRKLGLQKRDGEIIHRPGIDLTFSSPKSFSVQMHVFADDKEKLLLQEARETALHNVLDYIEQSGVIYTRKGKGGVIIEGIHRLTYALFIHNVSRNLDPQDHIHCLLANMTKCADGKYRSIVWEEMLNNIKFFGQAYRNELALEVKKLGYDIRTRILSDGSSSFELTKISQDLIDAFSTRRKELLKLFKLYGVTSKKGKDNIVINSRGPKKTLPEEELKLIWQSVVNSTANENMNNIEPSLNSSNISNSSILQKTDLGLTVEGILNALSMALGDFLERNIFSSKDEEILFGTEKSDAEKSDAEKIDFSLEAVAKLCLRDITHYQTTFIKKDLYQKILKYTIGKHSIQEIENSVTKLISTKEIVVSKEDGQMTSMELLLKEKYILNMCKKGIDTYAPQIQKDKFDKRFAWHEKHSDRGYELNNYQIKAIKYVMTCKNKIAAIQGLPGVGKSAVLDTVRAMSQRKIVNLIGTAPTASAAQTLEESSNIESKTLHKFIGQYKGYLEGRGSKEGLVRVRNEYKKSIIFVDEASLVGTRQMHDLLKLSKIMRFRIVLIGDTKQLSAVEAGSPFEQILKVIRSVKLDKIVRQQDPLHREAIKAVSDGNILRSFQIHEDNIKQCGTHREDFINAAVKQYLSFSHMERDNTILISPTRIHRDKVNQKIVALLTKEGSLKGESEEIEVYKQTDHTKADYNFAKCYKVGEVVKFYQNYPSLGIKKGEFLEIRNISEISNTIMFRKGLKDIRFPLRENVDYESKLDVFSKSTLQIQAGVKLRFTKNENGFINSQTATVDSITKGIISLKLNDDSTRIVMRNDLKHVDYGYCSTVHASQGKTTDRLIAAVCAHKKLNDQKSWLVTISRHKHDLYVYTDDKTQIQKYIAGNKGIERSAHEISCMSQV